MSLAIVIGMLFVIIINRVPIGYKCCLVTRTKLSLDIESTCTSVYI